MHSPYKKSEYEAHAPDSRISGKEVARPCSISAHKLSDSSVSFRVLIFGGKDSRKLLLEQLAITALPLLTGVAIGLVFSILCLLVLPIDLKTALALLILFQAMPLFLFLAYRVIELRFPQCFAAHPVSSADCHCRPYDK